MAEFYRKKKKVCQLCAGKTIDYKDIESLKRFVSMDKGKILPRRITGTCAKHQRQVANEIKKARFIAILPFTKK
ncbi:MAG: 30S ribosomal protein S18 [Candidatus Faecisoma sp.]|jgi:small subunit ribosomal protein S18|nr:30S ribosomal protein S18 [Acholeplasma sp.]MCI5677831.1 30S ribosomal protein S18 [Acholeplasma sp.]MDY2892688.1 30S ribosomal protein S18 [Candidatus Faecisoma sp.]CCY28035.1 30S ribosomal protein S18 [Acholeplasma sp. CAG:878]